MLVCTDAAYGCWLLTGNNRIFDPPEDNAVQKFTRSVVPTGRRVKDQTFGFDRIFDENVTQAEVYEATAKPLLDNVLDGYNATVFAYGATGCGKTHTITGTVQQPGIIFLTMQELFERISETTDDKVTEVSLSYLEIYNETIRDLLVPGNTKAGLMLREDANQAVSVAGLSSHRPQNVEEVMEMIMRGNELRTMSPTEANATSSRSHAVLQINVAQKDRNANVDEPHTMATLSIIDLAGSERASATKNRGARLLEGANINKSLLALGGCINALCDPRKQNHVPYRNSKLTRLLKFSLGGNCKTVMIVCVSPSSQHFDETQNTLRYANRAKNIQTKVTRNVYNVNRHVKDFLVKIDEQMALINELKAQQKDHEALAFAKFKKQNEKKESIARECIVRIRSAYEHSVAERHERTNNMIKLRQIGRRIALLSSWIAAFDSICDTLGDNEPMTSMHAVRKTAQGIMVELENSRHHCNQKVIRSTWDRALNSALENGLKQLKEVETGDNLDAETLSREVELLRANAERETLAATTEQDKLGDAAMVQVLLQAHFETIAAVERSNGMDPDEFLRKGQEISDKMLASCSNAVSHIVKPDGSLAPVEAFGPTKAGTPKRRKHVALSTDSPVKPINAALAAATHLTASPMRNSPKRRALLGSARKGVSFTPKKKRSPIKGLKRGVRWRDDTEDGTLAEFEKTPQKLDSTPEDSTAEVTLPQVSSPTTSFAVPTTGLQQDSSSPIPAPPEPSMNVHLKHNRFQTGFLAKKSDGSPLSMMPPPKMTRLSSSDTEASPLREIENGRGQNRPSISITLLDHVHPDNASTTSSSDGENNWKDSTDGENCWKGPNNATKADAMKIRSAVRRASSVHNSGTNGTPIYSASRTQRRRSPTAATAGSPPNENMFTTGQARRMVIGRSEKENEWKIGVLSPRVTGVVGRGSTRRTTMGEGKRERESLSVADRGPQHRMSSVVGMNSSAIRGSFMPGGKGAWR
jgi:kinesin family protein 18/19